jgi:hypothetical protein
MRVTIWRCASDFCHCAQRFVLGEKLKLMACLPPPRRLRTALLMAQYPEHVIQVVAHHLCASVRNHLRRA